MECILYIDSKKSSSDETIEAMKRVEKAYGSKNVRYEFFSYRPATCFTDDVRDNNKHVDLTTRLGNFSGIEQIRQFFPLSKKAA